ncbi:MAG: hypothetical protein ACRD1I_01100 [Terriglobia bacterium]
MPKPLNLKRAVLAILLFGVSFGYVEAAVVVYLREITEPVVERLDPGRSPADLFPLLPPAALKESTHPLLWKAFEIEIGREAATMVMLAAVAVAIGPNGTESLAAFVMAFGVWDIAFYGFLRIFIGWPASLLTWDLLFLLPVPWAGPVLAPVIVSLSMIVAGSLVLWRAGGDRPVRLNWLHWLGVLLGGLIIVFSFTWNFRSLLAGGAPQHFNWTLFAIGEALSLGAFLHAFKQDRHSRTTEIEGFAQNHQRA